MRKLMILTVITMFFVVSCDSDNDSANTADTANSVDSGDSANSANSGNTGNTVDSADSSNSADSGDTGNTGDSANSSDTGDTFIECIYNESNPDPCDNPDNTEFFPREYGGLHWSCPSENRMRWDSAQTYCTEKDGRLPTISELRILIRNCSNTEIGGACDLTDDCTDIDMCYSDACQTCVGTDIGAGDGEDGAHNIFCDAQERLRAHSFWSSTTTTDRNPSPLEVYFYGAMIQPCQGEEFENHAYCVQEK